LILAEVFGELGFNVRLNFVGDGEEMLDYLHGRSQYAGDDFAPRPDLILLDLHMPRMDGHEAVRLLRNDDTLHRLPVIVLSTTNNPTQIAKAYASGVNAFMTKPGRYDEFLDIVGKMGNFWFGAAKLPTMRPGP
jgi:CheY-like chemotaxis protein